MKVKTYKNIYGVKNEQKIVSFLKIEFREAWRKRLIGMHASVYHNKATEK